jgi:hypothetical protein
MISTQGNAMKNPVPNNQTPSKNQRKAVPFTDVKLETAFWQSRLETNRND